MKVNNADQVDIEGAPAGSDAGPETAGPKDGILDMALSTEPSKSLESVESPWNPEQGGPTRLMRAAEKAFGADGIPAILDAVIGLAEIYVDAQAETGNGDLATVEIEP